MAFEKLFDQFSANTGDGRPMGKKVQPGVGREKIDSTEGKYTREEKINFFDDIKKNPATEKK